MACTTHIPNKTDIKMVVEKEVTSILHSSAFIIITCTDNRIDFWNHAFPQNHKSKVFTVDTSQ